PLSDHSSLLRRSIFSATRSTTSPSTTARSSSTWRRMSGWRSSLTGNARRCSLRLCQVNLNRLLAIDFAFVLRVGVGKLPAELVVLRRRIELLDADFIAAGRYLQHLEFPCAVAAADVGRVLLVRPDIGNESDLNHARLAQRQRLAIPKYSALRGDRARPVVAAVGTAKQ